jgi:hypothetical protein
MLKDPEEEPPHHSQLVRFLRRRFLLNEPTPPDRANLYQIRGHTAISESGEALRRLFKYAQTRVGRWLQIVFQ